MEDFAVRLFPAVGLADHLNSDDYQLRGGGHHPGGRLALRGVPRGHYELTVEPLDQEHAPSAFVRVEVGDGQPGRCDVELAPFVERTLRVVAGDEPVAGSRVELLQCLGPAIDATTPVVPRANLFVASQNLGAVLVANGETDAHGAVHLRASATAPCTLRVSGIMHRPLVQPVVVGDVPDPWQVTVSRGATVRGRIRPEELVAILRQQAGLPSSGPVATEQESRLPSVRLVRGAWPDRLMQPPPGAPPASLADDGTFVIGGVVPGTWELEVVSTLPGGSRGGTFVAVVRVEPDTTSEVDVDLHRWLPATLTGWLGVDGEPYTGRAEVDVEGERDAMDRSRHDSVFIDVADGMFTTTTIPGRATVRVQRQLGEQWSRIRADETVDLVPGERAQASFYVRSRLAVLHLVDARGTPAIGVPVHLRNDADGDALDAGRTDEHGKVTVWIHRGIWTIAVTRAAYRDPSAFQKLLEEHDGDRVAAGAASRLDVDHVAVAAGTEPFGHRVVLTTETGY